jgi:hypothetical protein
LYVTGSASPSTSYTGQITEGKDADVGEATDSSATDYDIEYTKPNMASLVKSIILNAGETNEVGIAGMLNYNGFHIFSSVGG